MASETNAFDDIDPTKGAMLYQKIDGCSVGKTPSKFYKIRADLPPLELIKLVGYDPRTVSPKGKSTPGNISTELEQLIVEVQRTIALERVNEMVEYLYNAVVGHKYADWSEIDLVTVIPPDTAHWKDDGYVSFPQATAYFITDGQHRYCAIMDFVRQYPNLAGDFTVAVAIGVLPKRQMLEWAGQSFHDKNYLQKTVKATKALAVDARDLHNRLARDMHDHPAIKASGGVNMHKDSLAATSPEFITHSVLYKFVRGFTEGVRGLGKGAIKDPSLTEESYEELRAKLHDYLTMLAKVFPSWRLIPGREVYLFRASAAFQALGVLGFHMLDHGVDAQTQEQMIDRIGERKLDWRRANVATWGRVIGRIVHKNEGEEFVSPFSARQSVDATVRFLLRQSGIDTHLSPAEG